MNWTIFKSIHAVIAAVICVAMTVWLFVVGASIGAREGSDADFVLWSGWVAFVLMNIAVAYCLRKYIHKLGISPEFRRRVSGDALERTDRGLNEIRRKVIKGALTDRGEIEKMARTVLKNERVHKVVRVEVRDGDAAAGEPPFVIDGLPTEPYGRMLSWLHAHAYYGFASGIVVVLHGGLEKGMQSPLGAIMTILTFLVIITGVIGMYLFARGPTWLTRAEAKKLTFEQSFVLSSSLDEKIAEIRAKFAEEKDLLVAIDSATGARSDVDAKIAKALEQAVAAKPDAQAVIQDVMVLIGQKQRMQQGLTRLTRIRFWMNVWRVVHIPASIVLVGVVFLHAISVWWY